MLRLPPPLRALLGKRRGACVVHGIYIVVSVVCMWCMCEGVDSMYVVCDMYVAYVMWGMYVVYVGRVWYMCV